MTSDALGTPRSAPQPAGGADTGHHGPRGKRRLAGTGSRRLRLAGYAALLVLGLFALLPFVWMVLTSVRPQTAVFSSGIIPDTITFGAYAQVWNAIDLPSHFLTSAWITASTVVAVVLLSTLAGYSFAKLDFPGKRAVYGVVMSALMLPATAIVIPLFLELKQFHMIDSQFGLLLVYIGTSLPFATFLMRAFFRTLPDDLADAARVDGAGELRIFFQVMLPLAWPGVAALVIFQFMITWNEFLFANTLLQSPDKLPLQPVLYSLRGEYGTNWPALTAALTISVIPIIAVYFRMQRHFVAGLTMGALKD